MKQARDGNKSAMENLTMNDMDLYSSLSRRIMKEDVLSIVESSFIPYGIESDLLGEPQIGRRFKGRIWLQGHVNFGY